jgi:hypothetical protein
MRYVITEEQLQGFSDGIQMLLNGLYKNNPYLYGIFSQPISDDDYEDDESIEIVIVFDYDKIIHLSESNKNLLRIKYQKDVRNYVEKFFPNIEFGIYSQVKVTPISHRNGINENSLDSFNKMILKYFEKNFTPDEPWEDIEFDIIKWWGEGRIQELHLDDSGLNYYQYYNCNVMIRSLGKNHGVLCPAVDLDPETYESLNNLFGKMWKPLFIKWFNSKFKDEKIKIKNVDFY